MSRAGSARKKHKRITLDHPRVSHRRAIFSVVAVVAASATLGGFIAGRFSVDAGHGHVSEQGSGKGHNSRAPAPVSSHHVWAIVKVSYDPSTLKAEGSTCGTVFFVDGTTFVTAHHGNEAGSALFHPNPGYPNVRVFLANSEGDTIDDFWIVKRIPAYDLAIGRISRAHPAVRVCPRQNTIAAGDEVYNVGFPTDEEMREYSFHIEGQKLIVERIRMEPAIQRGRVRAIKTAMVRSHDVNLRDKMVAVLDYSSRIGFSGGPLVAKNSGKVAGLMSFVIPADADPSSPAVAIRMSDLEPFLEAEIQAGDD